ncbi:hypothetical protein [Pseudomonas aeruginosa]|nr:hypothetical protein [Pseudomonas aeruginosa]VZR88353.1 hypothetical protein PACF725_3434 [Pseudomonas aeruginosa]
MSSTQHQLIEQCATRLRGIVEALDNIHDTSPHRWSTDLDDVHSSAESLLALINDQAPTQDPQGLAGNGSLRHPCPAHIGPFDKLVGSPVHNESEPDLPPLDEHLAQVFETGMALSESVEQAGGDEREAAIAKFAETCPMTAESAAGGKSYDIELRRYYLLGWDDRAALAQPSTAQSDASFEEWLANELEGEDGQPVPAAVCDIALARRAFNHWPKLEKPAQVGGVRFSAGVSSRLVVEAAQRLYEFESTPEQEAERIERLQAFREQLDPLNLAPHAKAFNEAPAEALKSEQAEAERPEMSSERAAYFMRRFKSEEKLLGPNEQAAVDYVLSLIAQHERIVGALRFERQQMDRAFTACINERDAADARLHEVATACATAEQERDAALARVAELEMLLRELNTSGLMQFSTADEEKAVRAALSGAQAQHSAGYAEARMCANCRHIGINDAADYAACHDCNWTGPEPDEDKCPGCAGENCMAAACPECGGRYDLVAEANITAPAGQVPQAWLDVQAERRRQITAEGWTPEHDDAHSHGQMARAAACYALAGSSAPSDGTAALLVSLAWPWDEQWWKPSTARRDMVKACALGLAEIERLDRAAATQGGPRDA